MIFSEFHIGHWTPHIGDPSFFGWLTVYSYYSAACVCLGEAIFFRLKKQKPDFIFFFAISSILAWLGVCKQFNLPSAFTELGRIAARTGGWMQQRRVFQVYFMAGFGICLIVLAAVLLKRIPGNLFIVHRGEFFFTGFLIVFVLARAISFHPYESILRYEILGFRINWIGELAGIYGVVFSGIFYWIKSMVTRPNP